MNWPQLGFALTVPLVVGGLVALPFWLKKQAAIGTVVAAVLIFMAAVVLAAGERVDMARAQQQCLAEGRSCAFDVPKTFAHMATYGLIAFVQVGALFMLGSSVEDRLRRRHIDPEWR